MTLRSLSSIGDVSDESSSESDDVLVDWRLGSSSEDSDEWEGLRKSFDRFLKINVRFSMKLIYKKKGIYLLEGLLFDLENQLN